LNFESFNLSPSLFEGISAMGYEKATPIQQQAIPAILENKDLIACAQTGTGKTAAYLIPVIEKISQHPQSTPQCLVLAPTRELAKQIDEQVVGFGYFSSVTSIAVYGGNTGGDIWNTQRKAMEQGVDIIIATPGRLMAHMKMGYLDLSKVKYLILDEADKMLDMGFLEDITAIISELPAQRQNLLFSATMPPKIKNLADRILNSPEEIRIAISKPAERIEQKAYMVYDHQKVPLLEHLMKEMEVQSMIIFTARKSNVNTIVKALRKVGMAAKGIQSDLDQSERESIVQEFKNRQFQIMVATDIMSRGIDIEGISHVINYDVPQDAEDYIHRIGRTARAAAKGVAITLIDDQNQYRIKRIEALMEKEIPKLPIPEFLGTGPEFSATSTKQSGGGGGGKFKKKRPSGNTGNRSNGNGQAPREQRANGLPPREPRQNQAPRAEGQQGPRPEGSNPERKKRRFKPRKPGGQSAPSGEQGTSQPS
jgi:ATP-dependent RNA helicase RhlE